MFKVRHRAVLVGDAHAGIETAVQHFSGKGRAGGGRHSPHEASVTVHRLSVSPRHRSEAVLDHGKQSRDCHAVGCAELSQHLGGGADLGLLKPRQGGPADPAERGELIQRQAPVSAQPGEAMGQAVGDRVGHGKLREFFSISEYLADGSQIGQAPRSGLRAKHGRMPAEQAWLEGQGTRTHLSPRLQDGKAPGRPFAALPRQDKNGSASGRNAALWRGVAADWHRRRPALSLHLDPEGRPGFLTGHCPCPLTPGASLDRVPESLTLNYHGRDRMAARKSAAKPNVSPEELKQYYRDMLLIRKTTQYIW